MSKKRTGPIFRLVSCDIALLDHNQHRTISEPIGIGEGRIVSEQ